jgi:DNA invertase Pin-like site-specific DNA recombinase
MYVRMSTEHQQYSTENQGDTIRQWAKTNGYEIVETFADEGKSGLNIAGRASLQRLLQTVMSGQATFRAILAYDVSRWGRFQDADESAHYEYICRKAGIQVQYCAEQFRNDGSIGSTLIKTVKRSMAGEYSRELSVKVFAGQCRLIGLGFRQGGQAGFGLRRMLLDGQGNPKGTLQHGEQKSIQTDRVVLVPGPPEEVETVREMYQAFVHAGTLEGAIAEGLNAQGIRTDLGRPWTVGTVRQVLSNEKYIGNNVFNRTSAKLKQRRTENPPELWIRNDGAFQGIVNADLFYRAQGIALERSRRFSDEELLDKLRALHRKHGRLSGFLIDEEEGMPCSSAYQGRFGGLIRAYSLIGYTPATDYSYLEVNRRLRKKHPELVAEVVAALRGQGCTVEQDPESGLLLVNKEFLVSVVLSRCTETAGGSRRWKIRLEQSRRPDITIAVRMNPTNEGIHDYYVLPSIDMNFENLRLAEENGAYLDVYRQPDLGLFYELAERVALRVAA